jgi:hypothetical protein
MAVQADRGVVTDRFERPEDPELEHEVTVTPR